MMFLLLGLLGGLAGIVLCYLPTWLFLRHEPGLTAEEWRNQFPRRAWVTNAMSGVLVLGFLLFAPLFFTTDTTKEINWFLLPLVFFPWLYALLGILEVSMKTS